MDFKDKLLLGGGAVLAGVAVVFGPKEYAETFIKAMFAFGAALLVAVNPNKQNPLQ